MSDKTSGEDTQRIEMEINTIIGEPGSQSTLPLHINSTGEYLRKDLVLKAMQAERNNAIDECLLIINEMDGFLTYYPCWDKMKEDILKLKFK